jgi:hypothetical protein
MWASHVTCSTWQCLYHCWMIMDTFRNMVGHMRVKKQLHGDKHIQTPLDSMIEHLDKIFLHKLKPHIISMGLQFHILCCHIAFSFKSISYWRFGGRLPLIMSLVHVPAAKSTTVLWIYCIIIGCILCLNTCLPTLLPNQQIWQKYI